MTHTMLAAYMILDAAIAIGLVWLLREAAKTDRDRMTAIFYVSPISPGVAFCAKFFSLFSSLGS